MNGTPPSASGGASHDGGGAPNGGANGAGGSPATGGNSGTAGAPSSGGKAGATGGVPSDGGGAPREAGTCAPDLASSCLGQFFDQASQCFHPQGTCVAQTQPNGRHICWSNGAKLILTKGTSGGGFTYDQGGLCFYGSWTARSDGSASYTFTPTGADLLVYESGSGKTTCLDGTQTTLPLDFGHCTAITSLLALDDTDCTPGTCN